MNIMTKRGSLDNVVTYEHVCDAISDLQNISSKYTTLGSIAMVLNGESGGLEVYIANSNSEWKLLSSGSGSDGGGQTTDVMEIHICSNNEYDAETGLPTIEEPMEKTLYIVPATQEQASEGNLFNEYIFINNAWERFGGGAAAISDVQPDWNQNDSSAADFIKNRPFYSDITDSVIVYSYEKPSLNFTENYGYINAKISDPQYNYDLYDNGDKFILTIDGTIYEIPIRKSYDDDYGEWNISASLNDPYISIQLDVSTVLNIRTKDFLSAGNHSVDIKIRHAEQTEQIYQIDEKYLPLAAQSDWQQTDSNLISYIQNKPFYETQSEDVVIYKLTEQYFSFTQDNNGSVATIYDNIGFTPEIQRLINMYDDSFYECLWIVDNKNFSSTGQRTANGLLLFTGYSGSTNSAISIDYKNKTITVRINPTISNTTANVKINLIKTLKNYVHQINRKYVPQTSDVPDWGQIDPISKTYIRNKPFGITCPENASFLKFIVFDVTRNQGVSTTSAGEQYISSAIDSFDESIFSKYNIYRIGWQGSQYITKQWEHALYASSIINKDNFINLNFILDIAYEIRVIIDKTLATATIYVPTDIMLNIGDSGKIILAVIPGEINHLDTKFLPNDITISGNLEAQGGSITIGSTTITEQQLQALLNLLQ